MKPILNIITVTKDDLDGVASTIRSTRKLRAHTGVRQIIIDSSDDPVPKKIKELLVGENNIEYFWQKPSGIAAAFNLGIKTLNSEWAWFLNGRDEVHPNLNENLLLQILDSSQADVIIFQLEYKDSQMLPRRRPLSSIWPPMYPNWVPHQATFLRAGLFERFGEFNTDFKIAMDADLWMRLFSKNINVDMISIPVVLYDIGGVAATNLADTDKEARRIIRKNIVMLVKIWLGRGNHLFWAFTNFKKIFKNRGIKLAIRVLRKIGRIFSNQQKVLAFSNSSQYWDDRYSMGGNSGAGSYGRLARFKANVLNDFVTKHGINSVVEYGCGDGAQLELAIYPEYTGFDVSPKAVAICRKKFSDHTNYQFFETKAFVDQEGSFDLAISLDVIYHLIEDDIFEAYMKRLFAASKNFVIIYSNNIDKKFNADHVRGRKFSLWCDEYAKDWTLYRTIENLFPYDQAAPNDTSHSDFYIYKRAGQ